MCCRTSAARVRRRRRFLPSSCGRSEDGRSVPWSVSQHAAGGSTMRLAPKVTVIFVAAFGVMLFAAGILCYGYLQRNARNEVLAQAQLMMEAAAAMRAYTNEPIKPLVGVRRTSEFHAQWVPAYAATQVFN